MEILREPPKASTFVPLVEHQSATPASFYSGPPVLHYYSDRSKLIVLESEIGAAAAFAPLFQRQSASSPSRANGTDTNGDGSGPEGDQQRVVDDLDVWVTSEKLFLYSNSASAGVAIPYPSISLHAIQSLPQPSPGEQQGLYMQLVASTDDAGGSEDTEPESISVTIIPTASAAPAAAAVTGDDDDAAATEDKPEQTPVTALFNALSNCSNLHPDPVELGDEDDADGPSRLFQAGLAFPGATDGGLPPAVPGSGGWITAENMHEFVDENGNWIGGDQGEEEGDGDGDGEAEDQGLGPGAGTVRSRQEDGQGGDGVADEADETKWRRTS